MNEALVGSFGKGKRRKREREREREKETEKQKEKEKEKERKREREKERKREKERERSKGPRTVLQTIVVHCFETSAPRLCRTLLVEVLLLAALVVVVAVQQLQPVTATAPAAMKAVTIAAAVGAEPSQE